MERFVLLLFNLIIQAICGLGLNLTDFDTSRDFGLTDDILGSGRRAFEGQQHEEIRGASKLRTMLEQYIFVPPGGREEDLKAFLMEGRQPPRNPLDEFDTLHTGNMKQVVQLAKQHALQQDKHLQRLGIDGMEQWEREIEFYAGTGKDYRGKYKFGPEHKQRWMEKHKDKLEKFVQMNSTNQSDPSGKFGFRRRNWMTDWFSNRFRGYKPLDNMFILYNADERLNDIAKNFILQSIYQTRSSLAKTKEIRKRYRNDPTYRVAIIWGLIMNYKDKFRRLLATMYNTIFQYYWVKFYYVLIIYEKIMATYTDIRDMVHRLYAEHNALIKHFKSHMANGLLVIKKRRDRRLEARSRRARDKTYSQWRQTPVNYG